MKKNINKISRDDILQYELMANRFAKNISNNYLQHILGWWIAKKVTRKYNRYLVSLYRLEEIQKYKINYDKHL